MSTKVRLEVDKDTANLLRVRAAELGVTIPQLLAELATLDSAPRQADVAEIGRRAVLTASCCGVPAPRLERTRASPRD